MTSFRRIATAALVLALAGCVSSPASTTPTAAPSTSAAAPSASLAPIATSRPSAPTQAPRVPTTGTIDGVPDTTLSMGTDAAPIDIASAFGSIWVASHHTDTVVRLDPDTMATQATIDVGSGPGWFVVTGDAVWVSDQNGRGMTRIDPTTNAAIPHVGQWAPCWRGIAAVGFVWQPACDSQQIMRIDPKTNTSFDISSGASHSIVLAGGVLITGGDDGLARVDPKSGTSTPIGGPAGMVLGYSGKALWVSDGSALLRVRPSDGKVLSRTDLPSANVMAFGAGHAWVAGERPMLTEVDLATGSIMRTITFDPWPASVVEANGYLWVTNMERSSVSRLDL